MIQTLDKIDSKDWYITIFKESENSSNGQSKSFLNQLRRRAIDRFSELGFPTIRHEEWKYTNIAPLLQYNYKTVPYTEYPGLDINTIENFLIRDLKVNLLVFINGHFHNGLSSVSKQLKGVEFSNFAAAYKTDTDFIEKHFAKHVKINDGFTALNTAFVQDGAFIKIPDNIVVDDPVHLLFLSGDNETNALSQVYNLIYIGKNSQVKIIESYQSISENPYLQNSITDISMDEYSVVDYYKIQDEVDNSYHINKTQVFQERSSNFNSTIITLGSEIVRNDLNAVFGDEYGECNYFGFYLADGKRHIDNHTLIDHAKPHCHSNELYKGVLADKSRGVFNGKVIVRPDAQKTLAYQSNKNLLVSTQAKIDTKPQLEIFANDVKCSHGATVGQLDEQSIFYLQSRGISKEKAKSILIKAFAGDIIEQIKIEPLKEALNNKIFEKLEKISR